VNQTFRDFLTRPEQERRDVFDAAADNLDTVSSYVEKDFWVCLVLDILYNGLPSGHPRLLFKGGTSLSKVYGLISRFSEDVDFTVFREDLGFGQTIEPISRKQQEEQSEAIKTAAGDYISHKLKVDLEAIAASFSTDCSILLDLEDLTQSTLLFQYPSLFSEDGYVQQSLFLVLALEG
jgi:predicted nucleotidyltransferase component of viral defense system